MTRDEIIRMAREAGIEVHERKQQARVGMDAMLGIDSTDKLARFAALATERERASRQAAQIQVEQLQERIARAGVEQRRSVLAEREACAKVCDKRVMGDLNREDIEAMLCARAIRARSST